MRYVYVVHHFNKYNADIKSIGEFSSPAEAKAVVTKYKNFKGFKDTPDGFYVDAYELDKMYWSEGYYSVKVKSKQG
jgi:hypothetical protein